MLFVFTGIQILPLPDAVTLQFTTPPFAAIFAVFLVGEKWLPLDMIGAVVCLMGVAFIAHPTWLFGSETADVDPDATSSSLALKALAVIITEGGAMMAGLAYVSVRMIGHRASAVVMVFYYGYVCVWVCYVSAEFPTTREITLCLLPETFMLQYFYDTRRRSHFVLLFHAFPNLSELYLYPCVLLVQACSRASGIPSS